MQSSHGLEKQYYTSNTIFTKAIQFLKKLYLNLKILKNFILDIGRRNAFYYCNSAIRFFGVPYCEDHYFEARKVSKKACRTSPQYWINFLRQIFLRNMVKHREVIHNEFLKQKILFNYSDIEKRAHREILFTADSIWCLIDTCHYQSN